MAMSIQGTGQPNMMMSDSFQLVHKLSHILGKIQRPVNLNNILLGQHAATHAVH